MKIKLIKELRAEPIEVDVVDGTIIEDLVKEYQSELEYRVIAAKRNNTLVELTEEITEQCVISFLDMRTQAANLIYEKSLSLIYLKAVEDIFGRIQVDIQNVINKGLYTEVKTSEPITKEQIQEIEKRMREIVDADLPFEKYVCGPEEAMKIMEEDGYKFKQRLFQSMKVRRVKFYTLDGYRNFFYGMMTPSSGYIEYFELMKYRNGVLIRFPHPSNPKKIPEYVDEKMMYAT
ncbi:MAG: nucleoside kinase, partial [Firmicutes bacterium]|nr:nucleoside kinase [Bacillota bacterium]